MALLRDGPIEVLGRMPWSSNGTFLVALDAEAETKAVYKPRRGERPLWDFPSGLYKREAAAYELSRALGWGVVPPTIVRDGPLGEGSLQLFVDADFEHHYFTLQDDRRYRDDLMAICALDLVANNTDRKSGHCLLGKDHRIYAIDNGLSFHVEPKLRTVIWDFGGEELPASLLATIEPLARSVPLDLAALLDDGEAEAVQHRARLLLRDPILPVDTTGRRYPWPMV
jgi:uncharacterized repeat protein (TIGR03843 family)